MHAHLRLQRPRQVRAINALGLRRSGNPNLAGVRMLLSATGLSSVVQKTRK
jgi:hypothetical protein